MPCHSSGFSYERALEFAKEQGLDLTTVDLTNANDSIIGQLLHSRTQKSSALTEEGMNSPVALGGLRSCLRAPTLSYFALATNGLIMGTGNRSEDNLIRYFQKYGDGCVDLSPIADLFKSEVYELFAYMTGVYMMNDQGMDIGMMGQPASVAIYEATPTADLWGEDGGQTDEDELGFSYDEVEWADRQNMVNNIVTDDGDPTKHPAWLGYSMRQREVIAKVHQMEKISRHKYNPNLPVCEVRAVELGLVR